MLLLRTKNIRTELFRTRYEIEEEEKNRERKVQVCREKERKSGSDKCVCMGVCESERISEKQKRERR